MKELVKSIIEDGIVEVHEVAELRTEIFADGVVELPELQAVYEVAECEDKSNGALQELMIEVSIAYFLGEGDVEIDEAETEVFKSLVYEDGIVSELERKTAYALHEEANAICVSFETFCSEIDALRP
jgi:hypothetical protein